MCSSADPTHSLSDVCSPRVSPAQCSPQDQSPKARRAFRARAMDSSTCDVLVVGGGGAGLRAAIAVAETHPRLRVAVISKVYPMRSHTVSAEGGAAAVIKPEDSLDAHAYD